nr:hypothetical protein [Actinomycetota bacterium]
LPTMDVDDYPALPELAEHVAEVDGEILRGALARVLPAAGTDHALPILTGVKLDGDNDGLTLAATDRFRAARARIPWKTFGDPLDVLVSAEVLGTVSRATKTGVARLYAGDSTFGVATDTHRVTGRLMAGQYPKLAAVIPAPGDNPAVVDTADLSRAVDEAMVMLDEHPAVKLAITADGVEVSAAGEGRGARAVARVHSLHGEPLEVALNAGFLRAALRALDADAVAVHVTGPRRPVLMLPATTDGDVIDGYEHIVMAVSMP